MDPSTLCLPFIKQFISVFVMSSSTPKKAINVKNVVALEFYNGESENEGFYELN